MESQAGIRNGSVNFKCYNSNNAVRVLLLCSSCLRVTTYIPFQQRTSSTLCHECDRYMVNCKGTPCCSICAGEHLTVLHTYKRLKCDIKGTVLLHTFTFCPNCESDERTLISKNCHSYPLPNLTTASKGRRWRLS